MGVSSIFAYMLLSGMRGTKGDHPDLKKIRVSYFLMRNPSMKFQSLIVILLWTDGRKDGYQVFYDIFFANGDNSNKIK